ncbi:open rectifier potassium channel protein 1-like [Photinus pyralis]|nr:open rectifier potassium channel protein 1-like [Photinus pyralis]
MIYKIFLLVWIISGLGYLCMVMGFVARGMRSKKMCAIEHKLAINIKRTNHKIRDELRSIVNEYLLLRVKRVYREKFIYVPNKPQRSQSCPNLTIHSAPESPTISRKRAFSTCAEYDGEISRIQSDSDLERIDKEQTFNPSNAVLEPGQLLLRVANALGNMDTETDDRKSIDDHSYVEGINLFPSKEILATEKYVSNWSIGNERISTMPEKVMRPRAASECKTPVFKRPSTDQNDLTWYGPSATQRLQELREQVKYNQIRHKSLPPFTPSAKPQSLFSRLKNSLKPAKESDKNDDIESQTKQKEKESAFEEPCYAPASRRASIFSVQHEQVLEETSIADFLRALTAITVPEAASETAPLTPSSPNRPRRQPIQSHARRTSLMPISAHHPSQQRRFSLRPETTESEPPPPYYPPDFSNLVAKRAITRSRRSSSLRPGNAASSATSLQRSVLKLKYPITKDIRDTDGKNSSNV